MAKKTKKIPRKKVVSANRSNQAFYNALKLVPDRYAAHMRTIMDRAQDDGILPQRFTSYLMDQMHSESVEDLAATTGGIWFGLLNDAMNADEPTQEEKEREELIKNAFQLAVDRLSDSLAKHVEDLINYCGEDLGHAIYAKYSEASLSPEGQLVVGELLQQLELLDRGLDD